MGTDENRTTVRRAFEAWQSGTVPIAELFAEDMKWRIEGNSLAAGEFQNKKHFLDRGAAFNRFERVVRDDTPCHR